MPADSLDQILDALHRARQRATYGAVASVLGAAPRTLMKSRDRDQRHSWVVSQKTRVPTGYTADELHPDLMMNDRVIESREDLSAWLQSQPETSELVAAT